MSNHGITIALEEHRELQERFGHMADYCRELEIKLAAQPAPSHEIEECVIQLIRERRERGRSEHGHTMERQDLSRVEWLRHAQSETLDFSIYIEKEIQEVQKLEDQLREAWGIIQSKQLNEYSTQAQQWLENNKAFKPEGIE